MTRVCLPVENRTESFWLTERDDELQFARTTATLPTQADVVIVGSGLSGAMMGYHLYRKAEMEKREISVVMLEAAEICGSATARNGGHCKPVTFIGYRAEKAKRGADTANHMLTFEEAALKQYADIVQREGIDCDMHATRAFDVFFREDDAQSARLDYLERLGDYPQSVAEGAVRIVDDPSELKSHTGVMGGLWGASYPAGHLWPYKLATNLIRKLLRMGLNVQAQTPAVGLEQDAKGVWSVKTARGTIQAGSVIVTTNAYTSSLLPEFKSLIVPVRGTACSIAPASSHSPGGLPGPIKYTYGFRHGPGEVDYMIPRQGRGMPGMGDRSVILGGAKGCFLQDIDAWYDNINDNVEMPGVRQYFEGFMEKYFEGWNGGAKGNVEHVWSGVLGYSSDMIPYVGEHPDRPGVFLCAGFTGHGMPRIPGCTDALSTLVLSHVTGGLGGDDRRAFEKSVPSPYWMTRERLESKRNVIKEAMGQGDKSKESFKAKL